jgi:hypothetical protein
MAFTKELPDEILKDYHGPDDFYGPQGIMKQLTRALVERTMEAELTFHLGYEKHDQGEKTNANRRNGKTTKEPGNEVSTEFKGFDDKILSMVNIRDGSTVVKKSVYADLAIRLDGQKELGETKFRTGCGSSKTKGRRTFGSRFWTAPTTGLPLFPGVRGL